MTETIFGAGGNQAIKIRYGVTGPIPYVSPSLAMNFFSVAMNMAHNRFAQQISNLTFQPLLSYVEKYWKRTLQN
jgi:hypothetical protein